MLEDVTLEPALHATHVAPVDVSSNPASRGIFHSGWVSSSRTIFNRSGNATSRI
jgi:hypothetical protein